MQNKRGQFFLIAAIIVVGLIIGFASAVNSVNVRNNNEAFYDLADQVGFEIDRVLDYGVYNQQDTLELAKNFLEDYTDNLALEQAVFIYGNLNEVRALYFSEIEGSVGINTGTAINGVVTIRDWAGWESEVRRDNGKVIININGVEYISELRPGENFYFIITKYEDGEIFVAKGG